MERENAIPRHRTALKRTDLSRPAKCALRDSLITSETSVFDYGCGRGGDVELLGAQGVVSAGWDPVFFPDRPFLADCYNRDEAFALYLQEPRRFVAAAKVPLPLGGGEALLLEAPQAEAFYGLCETVRSELKAVDPAEQIAACARILSGLEGLPLPRRLVDRLERYLHPASTLVLSLTDTADTADTP